MTEPPTGPVLRHVRRLAAAHGSGATDAELLRAFASRRDEAAFAALVRRHGPMVFNVCRRVLGHRQDAEDAFQATFLVLARKADSVARLPALAGWLYGAASRMALSARRAAARRRGHEARAKAAAPANPAAELAWSEVQALLEEEIRRLPEKYRAVFVRCCLEGEGRAEAARLLGLSEGTVSSRLDTARKRLRQRLARRGVTLGAVLAAAALTQRAAALTPALLGATARAAAVVAAGGPTAGVVSESVLALVEGGRTMFTSPLKLATVLALALSLAAGVALTHRLFAHGDRPEEPRPGADTPKAEAPAPAVDRHGDPLPAGTVARFGTVRFRHGSSVTGVAFLPDGKTLLTGSFDRTLRLWDVATGREARRVGALRGSVTRMCLSKDGKTVAAVDTGELAFGDVTTGRLTRQTLPPGDFYPAVALAPDGKTVAAGSSGLGVWETATGKHLRQIAGYDGKVKAAAFSPDGKLLATTGEDGTVRLWDNAGTETLRIDVKGPAARAQLSVAFSPDGRLLAAGGKDGKLRLWELPGGKLLREVGSHFDGVESVTFSPDGKTVVSASTGTPFSLWDVSTGKERARLWGYAQAVAFSPDGGTLASVGNDGIVRLWDAATARERPDPGSGHRSAVRKLAVSSDGTRAVTYGDRAIRLWEVATGKELRQLENRTAWIGTVALSPDGKVVATNTGLWDAATGKRLGKLPERDYNAEHLSFAPDGRTLAMATADPRSDDGGAIRVWGAADVKELKRFGRDAVHALSNSPDGKTLAAGGRDGSVVLWDVGAGREVHRLRGHTREVNSVAFSPDGRLVASSTFNGDIILWDAAAGKELSRLTREDDRGGWGIHVLAVTFAPNGKVLASAEQPTTSESGHSITLWELATGRVRLRLAGHQGDVDALAFAGNSRTLISCSNDTTALVWDVTALPSPAAGADPERLWEDLRSEDATAAYWAMRTLMASKDGLAFLGRRLRPAATADERQVAGLVKRLDGDTFADREEAARELESLGEAVEPILRKTLEARPSAEVRRRLERQLDRLSGDWLRARRAVELLELAGTAEAQRLLRSLANGAKGARLTREADAALDRVGRRPAAAVWTDRS